MAITAVAAEPCRVVLDSNVWVDILLFDDPVSRPITTGLESGQLLGVIDADCLEELRRVLDYPQFERFVAERAAALARVARLTLCVETPLDDRVPALPLCRDRDDQKFLQLARSAGAHWLVSKDRELLRMDRRIARDFGFRIGKPAQLVEWLSGAVSSRCA